ncbi:hypothetical protein [Pedobacter helvus]|uniref:Uncharacterized protein n=1 Tax=Pedobacter helvus TaxID=2563444 RepID=A0ABW9JGT2_9SPHI|nr:hypothetical protein [Pedobacter ureilyticus]
MINTFLNFCLKWFYRKDKEITTEIESFEKISALTAQLSQALDENKALADDIDNLRKVNTNLSSRNLDATISEISRKDYDTVLNYINASSTKEKLKFSFRELLGILKKKPNIDVPEVYSSATYKASMENLISYLASENLLKTYSTIELKQGRGESVTKFEFSPSFKDFLNIDTD